MKIPKTIQIAGKTIEVIFDDKLCDEINCWGQSRFNVGEILIQKKSDSIDRKKDHIEQTFIHEIVHWICEVLHHDELRKDERFTSQFSELLYQVIKQL